MKLSAHLSVLTMLVFGNLALAEGVNPSTIAADPRVLGTPMRPSPSPVPQQKETPAPAIGPSSPVPVTTCDGGGCWSGAERYRGGAGNAYLNKNGRLCQRSGSWMQCF